MDETLWAHISTQSRFVGYRPKKRLSEPKPARDAMNEHMETINKRVERKPRKMIDDMPTMRNQLMPDYLQTNVACCATLRTVRGRHR